MIDVINLLVSKNINFKIIKKGSVWIIDFQIKRVEYKVEKLPNTGMILTANNAKIIEAVELNDIEYIVTAAMKTAGMRVENRTVIGVVKDNLDSIIKSSELRYDVKGLKSKISPELERIELELCNLIKLAIKE